MGLRKFAGHLDFDRTSETMRDVVESTFNATISITDPKVATGTYDRNTNTISGQQSTVLWTGPARIQAMRWPSVASGRGDSVSLRTVVFHLPYDAQTTPKFIRDGMRIEVIDGGLSEDFESALFVVTTSVNTSYAWDRRVEAIMDQGTDLSS